MFIRRLKVKPPAEGDAGRIWPPPGETPVEPGTWYVTVLNNGSAAVEVVDEPNKTVGAGVLIASKGERTFGPLGADELWAAVGSGEEEVTVIACGSSGGS